MRLGPDVLLEIMTIIQRGFVEGIDVSEQMRAIDLEEGEWEDADGLKLPRLVLSSDYLTSRGRNYR